MKTPTPPEKATQDARRAVDRRQESEAAYRERADWLKALGPDDRDPEQIMQDLEQYGFEKMDDDIRVSVPTAEEIPGWDLDNAGDPSEIGERLAETDESSEDRPVEDAALDDISNDASASRK